MATFMAWIWQGTIPGTVTLAGGALALLGVILVQSKGRPRAVISVAVASSGEQRAAVRELATETMANMAAHLDLPMSYFDEELEHFDEWYGGLRGRALLATVDGVPAAVAVFRPWKDGYAELRRLYVRPAYRRRGLARALVKTAVDEAALLGYRRVVLMTSDDFEGAADLYESEGFERVEPYRPAATREPLAFARSL